MGQWGCSWIVLHWKKARFQKIILTERTLPSKAEADQALVRTHECMKQEPGVLIWHCSDSCRSTRFITHLCLWGTNPHICQAGLTVAFHTRAIKLPELPLCRVFKTLVSNCIHQDGIIELPSALSTGYLIRAWKSYQETEIMTLLLLNQFNFKIKNSKEKFEGTWIAWLIRLITGQSAFQILIWVWKGFNEIS